MIDDFFAFAFFSAARTALLLNPMKLLLLWW
jgi:hypothetical protein